MRGLNLISKSRSENDWARYQYQCCARASKKLLHEQGVEPHEPLVVEPLFPGSMLFSQILVGSGAGPRLLSEVQLPDVPESFNCFYASFGIRDANIDLSTSVIVDWAAPVVSSAKAKNTDAAMACRGATLTNVQRRMLEHQIDSVCADKPQVEQLVFLQESIYKDFKDVYTGTLKLRLHLPDWYVFAEIMHLYRRAVHSVFVNNMRVMDAAFSACSCSVIIENSIEEIRSQALISCLAKTDDCQILTVPADSDHRLPAVGAVPLNSEKEAVDVLLCENTRQSLGAALSTHLVEFKHQHNNDEADYFNPVEYTHAQVPVINAAGFEASTVRARMANRRIKLIRKTNKLREDPRSFCIDSAHPLIRAIGRVLPVKNTAA